MSGYKAFVSLKSVAGNRSLFFRTDLVLFVFYLKFKKKMTSEKISEKFHVA